ncbi:MAG: bifunctional hydroxymethylpyrimidine kinase/phosphomethylpyrimidine kinase [Deltaproteobacteria bacterium]|nr:bifunctional hydroxymethylpyrimidine kinase/phosphomethylpyrimidine kinase [Deltaproteobacteria bacterium]
MIARALTIGGSDSSGGAGIQADLKTFTVWRVYGMSAVTALTAQNTCGVSAIHVLPPDFVLAQIAAVTRDIGVDAAKTGMLADAEIVCTVAAAVREQRIPLLVVDPVMVAQSGAVLLQSAARDALLQELIPLATLVTPNVPEAEVLTGLEIASVEDMQRAARHLIDRGARACLLKGGHLGGNDAVDIFHDGRSMRRLSAPRAPTTNTHGTGCQLSAAITAALARGASLSDAIDRGKQFITLAIGHALAIGKGNGPANPLAWLDEPS